MYVGASNKLPTDIELCHSGDPSHAIRLVALLRDMFKAAVPIHDVFRFSTVFVLAGHLKSCNVGWP
jgi:hypothetical protein